MLKGLYPPVSSAQWVIPSSLGSLAVDMLFGLNKAKVSSHYREARYHSGTQTRVI